MSARLEELRARFAAHRAALAKDDPIAFARNVGLTPDPWQARMLRSSARRLILCCSRQAGKSTGASILVTHRAIYDPGHLALLISPSLRQSGELFRKVRGLIERVGVKLAEDNALSVTLENGSRIVSLPSSEDTIRGYSAVDTLVEDEAAFVSDAINVAIRPMLAVSNGQLVLMSSPNGRRGHFFEAWERGGDAWERYAVKASDIPRISPEFLREERRALGELRFRQEYECEFIAAATGSVYRYDETRNGIARAPERLTHRVLGVDYGFTDDTAFAVVAWRDNDPTVYVLESFKQSGLEPSAAAEVVYELDREHRFERIVGDIGGLGKGYAEEARRRFSLPIEPAEKTNKRGYIDLLNDALATSRLKVVTKTCGQLLEEWQALCWDESRAKELAGMPNHCADAVLYAWRACPNYHERAAEERPQPGTTEALRAEEKAMEDALDEEMELDAERDRARSRGRFWR